MKKINYTQIFQQTILLYRANFIPLFLLLISFFMLSDIILPWLHSSLFLQSFGRLGVNIAMFLTILALIWIVAVSLQVIVRSFQNGSQSYWKEIFNIKLSYLLITIQRFFIALILSVIVIITFITIYTVLYSIFPRVAILYPGEDNDKLDPEVIRNMLIMFFPIMVCILNLIVYLIFTLIVKFIDEETVHPFRPPLKLIIKNFGVYSSGTFMALLVLLLKYFSGLIQTMIPSFLRLPDWTMVKYLVLLGYGIFSPLVLIYLVVFYFHFRELRNLSA